MILFLLSIHAVSSLPIDTYQPPNRPQFQPNQAVAHHLFSHANAHINENYDQDEYEDESRFYSDGIEFHDQYSDQNGHIKLKNAKDSKFEEFLDEQDPEIAHIFKSARAEKMEARLIEHISLHEIKQQERAEMRKMAYAEKMSRHNLVLEERAVKRLRQSLIRDRPDADDVCAEDFWNPHLIWTIFVVTLFLWNFVEAEVFLKRIGISLKIVSCGILKSPNFMKFSNSSNFPNSNLPNNRRSLKNKKTLDVKYTRDRATQEKNTKKMSTTSCHSKYFNEGEIEKLQQEFQKFDADKSGDLDAAEVQIIIEQATGNKPSIAEVEYVIKQVDHNSNNVLEFNEFLDMVKYVKMVDREALEQFKFFDANDDGYIEYKELKKALNQLNERLSKAEIKLMLTEADVDKDGKINFEEFKEMLVSGN